jgi:hypothetical protein
MASLPMPQPTGNPLLDNPALKAQLTAQMQQPAAQQGAVMPPAGAAPPPSMNIPAGPPPAIPGPASPEVKAPRGTSAGDEAELSRKLSTGSGISQIAGKIENSGFGQKHPVLGKVLGIGAQGLAQLGDIGLRAVAPAIDVATPGTSLHHLADIHGDQRQVGQDVANEEKQAQTGEVHARTQNLEAQPELTQAKNDLAQNKLDETQRLHDQQLREHGFKLDEKGQMVPLPYEEMSEPQQAVQDLKGSQEELADASAALKKVQADPNSPQARAAQQRIDNAKHAQSIAMQRLGLSQATFEARYHGTDTSGNSLPGAMMTDEGKPVGSSFSANVRPTGTERNKADLANSAAAQISDMKAIVQKHPDFFGPGYGQTSAFKQWIGSEDPDAQRFLAARTIAGDHLAGTFGGRSEAALQALDKALGQFKDNPKAALAGLDQLSGANKSFQKAGTVHTAGSSSETPKEGTTKTNAAGDQIVYKGGKWQAAESK